MTSTSTSTRATAQARRRSMTVQVSAGSGDNGGSGRATASCADVLKRLARLSSTALVTLLLPPHGPAIGNAVQATLHVLARRQLAQSCYPRPLHDGSGGDAQEEEEEGEEEMAATGREVLTHLAIILHRVLERGDPSLARTLLPRTATLIDLALALGTLHSVPLTAKEGGKTKAEAAASHLRSALGALIDPALALEVLKAAHTGVRSGVLDAWEGQTLLSASSTLEDKVHVLVEVQKRGRMLALLLSALPPLGSRGTGTGTGTGKMSMSVYEQLAHDIDTLYDVVVPALFPQGSGGGGKELGLAAAAARIHLRDAAVALEQHTSARVSPATAAVAAAARSSSHDPELDELVAALTPKPPTSTSRSTQAQPQLQAQRRANIFDDEGPLDLSKFRYKSSLPTLDAGTDDRLHDANVRPGSGGGGRGGGLHKIPEHLKASVLARVAAQQHEEQEEADEEWDLGLDLAIGGGGGGVTSASRIREAGVEEELEEEEGMLGAEDGRDWFGRRGMMTSLAAPSSSSAGAVPSARGWRRKFGDESSGEEGEEDDALADHDAVDENANAAGIVPPAPSRGVGGGGSSHTTTTAALERAADRILTRFYATHGAALFARGDPALRKGNTPLGQVRRQLIAELERETGKKWDAGLVESWGTMFERNPRKDKLLARSTDLLGPNPNRPTAQSSSHTATDEGDAYRSGRQFGPDRGRGGRILRGAAHGRGGGGGGGASGGPQGPGSSSGSGTSSGGRGGAGRGQHSGSNRAARQKEKRGSSARFRGGRGGGMARSGAFPAGIGGGGD